MDTGHVYVLCGDVGDTQVRHISCSINIILI